MGRRVNKFGPTVWAEVSLGRDVCLPNIVLHFVSGSMFRIKIFRAAIGMGQHTRERTEGVILCLIFKQLGGERGTMLIFRT